MNSENPANQKNAAPNAKNEPDQHAAPTQPIVSPTVGSAKPETPPTTEKCKHPHYGKKHWLDYLQAGMGGIGLLVLVIYTVATILLLCTAKDAAKWAKEQVISFYNSERPTIFVKMPDKIHVEVGKPIEPTIELLNYGKAPGMVRARVHFEGSEGAIERFRDMLLHHGHDFLIAPDDKTTLNIVIRSDESVPYPIETPPIVLTQEDINKLAIGKLDVAIYGRIFYYDMSVRAHGIPHGTYTTSFCFYFQSDGTPSACPNKEHAYTNFAP